MQSPTASTDDREFGTSDEGLTSVWSRRRWLVRALGSATVMMAPLPNLNAKADDDTERWVRQRTGKTPSPSPRVRLFMPKTFPNGYTVPLAFDVDTPMTQADHVVNVRILAPKNPIPNVATFYFAPGRSVARVSTRIRLAEPQFVVALATMNDDALLMAKAWVDVASDGCK